MWSSETQNVAESIVGNQAYLNAWFMNHKQVRALSQIFPQTFSIASFLDCSVMAMYFFMVMKLRCPVMLMIRSGRWPPSGDRVSKVRRASRDVRLPTLEPRIFSRLHDAHGFAVQ